MPSLSHMMIFISTILTFAVPGTSCILHCEPYLIAKYRSKIIDSTRQANKKINAIELECDDHLRRFKILTLQRVIAFKLKKNNAFKQLFKECVVRDAPNDTCPIMCPIMCPIQDTISKSKSNSTLRTSLIITCFIISTWIIIAIAIAFCWLRIYRKVSLDEEQLATNKFNQVETKLNDLKLILIAEELAALRSMTQSEGRTRRRSEQTNEQFRREGCVCVLCCLYVLKGRK
jgi:hypothetical protein